MTFHNLSGETRRQIVLLLSADDILDAGAMKRLHKFLPKDAQAAGVMSLMGNQVAMTIESVEFMPVPFGGAIPVKPLPAIKE